MKYKAIDHWKYSADLEGLLFFAQAVDEMLFDYTLDAYKPPALNVRSLCVEALKTIAQVDQGLIRRPHIDIIMEELRGNLESDFTAKSILGPRHSQICLSLARKQDNLSSLSVVIQLLYSQFNNQKYLRRVKENLRSVIHDPKQKELIHKLSRILVSELINYGYHPNYIYFQVNSFFFDSSKRPSINSTDELAEFLESFDFKPKKFKVIFKASKIFLEFKEVLTKYKIEALPSYVCTSHLPFEKSYVDSIKDDEIFLICSEVEHLDSAAARQDAEKTIGSLSNVFSYFHHKEKPQFSNDAIVCRMTDNHVAVLTQPTKSILKSTDAPPRIAAAQMKQVMDKLDLSGPTMYRFIRGIDLHSVALETSAIENQLLDLWAAVETLIARPANSKSDRISQIADSLVPFIQLNYVRRLLDDVSSDLKRWNRYEANKILSKMALKSSTDWFYTVAFLICTKTNEHLRSELYSKMDRVPLLRHRVYMLHKLCSNPIDLHKAVLGHGKKVGQQIRRIYRTRNAIIHSGEAPPYTAILVEHLHKYLDIFIERVIELEMTEKKIKTINEAILETKFAVEHHTTLMQHYKNNECTEDNYRQILFGE